MQQLQLQQTIATLQQSYLSNPTLCRDYNQLIEQLNINIATEARKLELYQQLLIQALQGGQTTQAQPTTMADTFSSSNLFNMQDALLATQLAAAQATMSGSPATMTSMSAPMTSTTATTAATTTSSLVQPRGQLRIDQLFSTVPNRNSLSGTSHVTNLKPKEEPRH
jgi:hypothetical protein